MKKTVAVVGGGYWGKNLIRSFHQLGALRTVCDTNLELLKTYAERYTDIELTSSYHDVLARPDIDAVVIATPAVNHYSAVKEALNAGKDVFVEKPLALTSSDRMMNWPHARRNSNDFRHSLFTVRRWRAWANSLPALLTS